jgi:hypothetical protein
MVEFLGDGQQNARDIEIARAQDLVKMGAAMFDQLDLNERITPAKLGKDRAKSMSPPTVGTPARRTPRFRLSNSPIRVSNSSRMASISRPR